MTVGSSVEVCLASNYINALSPSGISFCGSDPAQYVSSYRLWEALKILKRLAQILEGYFQVLWNDELIYLVHFIPTPVLYCEVYLSLPGRLHQAE